VRHEQREHEGGRHDGNADEERRVDCASEGVQYLTLDIGWQRVNGCQRSGRVSVRLCAAGNMPFISAVRRAAQTAPKTAVPNEPPIDRKNVAPLVAVPIWLGETAFCTARISTCITLPKPSPRIAMGMAICQYGVSEPSRESMNKPTVARAVPMIGNGR